MTRENLAEVLEEIALLLELKDENPFKIRAYRQGAETVRNYDGEIVELAEKNQLTGIKGIGEALRDKLHELASTGKLEFYEKLRAEFPAGLFELFDLQGLGPKKVKALYEALAISNSVSSGVEDEALDVRHRARAVVDAHVDTKGLEPVAHPLRL